MARFENTAKWQPIQDTDMTKRTPEEWAKIYNIKLTEEATGFWSEYEWAYNFDKLSYVPIFEDDGVYDWDKIANWELRAMNIRRDIFMGADMGEKDILKQKYIETQWLRDHTLRI